MMQRWRESFANDPDQAVADLFSGRAGVGAAFRRDVPEILYHEFPDLPEFAAARDKLDDALLAWLDGMRTDYRRQVARLDHGVYALRICEALGALQLLNLPHSIHHIREVHVAWLRWLAPLRLAPERDPALESWRLLSLRQPDHATPAPWLRLAADARDEYLAVALVGLQRLPLADLKQNQTLMLAALLQHCAGSGTPDQSTAEFKRQFAALRGRYPRGPEHWQGVLDTAIAAAESNNLPSRLAQLIEGLRRPRRHAARPAMTTLPSVEENRALLAEISDSRQATASVVQRFVGILERYLQYAQHTGDAYFFVRTLCNHGKRLLQRRDLPIDLFDRIGDWIEEALRWEPNHEFTWTFWADSLAWQGREAQQEWVLREAVRLFPDNAPSRVELARLLICRDEAHWSEAERWLREATQRNPYNAPSRVELARFLLCQGEARWPEAERWLREATQRDPDNAPSRVVLAKLLATTGRTGEGIELLRQLPASDTISQGVLRQLEAGATHFQWDDSNAHSAPMHATAPAGQLAPSISETGLLASLRIRAEAQARFAAARDGMQTAEARTQLKNDADAGDALSGLYATWLGETTTQIPPHAWAWQLADCFRTGTPADWQEVGERFPEYFDLSQYLHWLANPEADEGRLAAELERRFKKQGETDDTMVTPARRFAVASWRHLHSTARPDQAESREDTALALLQAEAEPIVVC